MKQSKYFYLVLAEISEELARRAAVCNELSIPPKAFFEMEGYQYLPQPSAITRALELQLQSARLCEEQYRQLYMKEKRFNDSGRAIIRPSDFHKLRMAKQAIEELLDKEPKPGEPVDV